MTLIVSWILYTSHITQIDHPQTDMVFLSIEHTTQQQGPTCVTSWQTKYQNPKLISWIRDEPEMSSEVCVQNIQDLLPLPHCLLLIWNPTLTTYPVFCLEILFMYVSHLCSRLFALGFFFASDEKNYSTLSTRKIQFHCIFPLVSLTLGLFIPLRY